MLTTSWVRSYGPMLKLLLFCTGTLMSEATGFCVAFCSAAASSAALGVAGLSAEGAGLTAVVGAGASCANADRLNKRIRGSDNCNLRFIVLGPSELVASGRSPKIVGSSPNSRVCDRAPSLANQKAGWQRTSPRMKKRTGWAWCVSCCRSRHETKTVSRYLTAFCDDNHGCRERGGAGVEQWLVGSG